MDGSSNLKDRGVSIILKGPKGITIEQSLRFNFKASNNQTKYEALIANLQLAKEMGANPFTVKNDSQLVTSQVFWTEG